MEKDLKHRTSIESFRKDQKAFDEFINRLSEWLEGDLREEFSRGMQGSPLIDIIRPVRHPHITSEIFAFGAIHPRPEVRFLLLQFAKSRAKSDLAARDLIVWLLQDDEDFIVFDAIRTVGQLRLGEGVSELISISGPASNLGSSKPVGVGASQVRLALSQVFNTVDHHYLERYEEEYFESGKLPKETQWDESFLYEPENLPEASEMVRIRGGDFISGVNPENHPNPTFDVTDCFHERVEKLPDFLIDHAPVSNREYDEWADSNSAISHEFCHPDEPEEKDHRRGSRIDARFEPEHPVVGVDWFDAYAYLAAHGKELPSELEWERAARGKVGNLYPWGNEWNPEATQWAGNVFNTDITDLSAWRTLLRNHNTSYPSITTVPIASNPQGKTPEGVYDLVGNAWEWTRTNFFTRSTMSPETNGRPRPEWATAEESFAVIRGGAWSSFREQTTGYFRGRDLITDRHNEITFRGIIR